MKRKMKYLMNLPAIIMTILVFNVLSATTVIAQVVLPNVRLNDADNVNASTEGSKCIAAVGDNIYTVWSDKREGVANVYFSKSTDGGLNFSSNVIVCSSETAVHNLFPSIFVSPAEDIYVAWNRVTGASEDQYNIFFTKSTDGGTSFAAPTPITTNNSSIFPSLSVYGSNIYIFYGDLAAYPLADYYLVRSEDDGTTFETPVKVNDDACVESVEIDGVTSLALDGSGNIYMAWIDGRRTGGKGDIYFAKSLDNGVTISSNVMVNDIGSAGVDAVQYKPKITVGAINKVYISFVDKRLGDDWTNNRVYLSVSTNGGTSFSPEVLLAGHDGTCKSHDLMANSSDKLSVVLYSIYDLAWGTWLLESPDGGSTFSTPLALNDTPPNDASDPGIFLSSSGDAYTIWIDYRTGSSYDVYFSRTSIVSNNNDISIGKNVFVYPNPTDDVFTIDLGTTFSNISVNILNIQGQTIYKQNYNNTQKLIIDTVLPTGVYFINIEYDRKVTTLKLINN